MKISKPLPDHIKLCEFDNREALTEQLAELLISQLNTAIENNGSSSLAVSGGSTPVPLFKQLSNSPLAWNKVSVTLVDDRWLNPEQSDSNQGLLAEHLLRNSAEQANFIPLWQANSKAETAVTDCHSRLQKIDGPLDAVILGMGNDGHTASLFPCADELDSALNSTLDCCAVNPTTAPYTRMTLTPHRLLNSDLRILHICGQDKMETLAKALENGNVKEMPVRLFLQHPITIFWAP